MTSHHTRVWPPRTKQILRLRIAVRSGNCCSVRDRGCDDGRNLPSDQPNTYTKSLSTISLCDMDLEPNNHALQLREIWGGGSFFWPPPVIQRHSGCRGVLTRVFAGHHCAFMSGVRFDRRARAQLHHVHTRCSFDHVDHSRLALTRGCQVMLRQDFVSTSGLGASGARKLATHAC